MRSYMKHSYELKKGYEAEEMVALLQKSIRRSELNWSLFAAMELYHSKMGDYIWERLIIIAAEDMYGTASTTMAKYAREYFKAKKAKDNSKMLKAVYNGVFFASRGLKSRDADNLICISYFNEAEENNVKKFLDNKGTTKKFLVDETIFNVETFKFSSNKGWLKYIDDQNKDTANYVKFTHHKMPSKQKALKAIQDAFKKKQHKVVAYLLYTMVDNNLINEAWTLLRDMYVKDTPELQKEFEAMVFSKEQISQQKESKLYFGKIITLWLLLKRNKDVSNEVKIKWDRNFVSKYYDKVDPHWLPAYTYDLHTERGRLMKFTQKEFIARENDALVPKAKNLLFDKYMADNINLVKR